MQGCGPGDHPPRANTAAIANGTTEAKIFKRNMIRHPLDPGPQHAGLMVGGA